MRLKEQTGSLMLLAASVIWGSSFVAQSMGMEHMGPFSFQFVRSLIGSLSLVPVLLFRARGRGGAGAHKEADPASPGGKLLRAGLLCGVVLALGANLQQFALTETTAGKAGFLTSTYILIVPLLEMFRGSRPRPAFFLSVGVALWGLWLLSAAESLAPGRAEAMLLLCALVYAFHILLADHFLPWADPVALCCLQFLVAGLLSGVLAMLTEPFSWAAVAAARGPLLFTGVFSSGVAFTLQLFGQRKTSPSMASMLMSLESVFAVAAGALLLGERPSPREMLGSALMLAAIVLAQGTQGRRPVRKDGASPEQPLREPG